MNQANHASFVGRFVGNYRVNFTTTYELKTTTGSLLAACLAASALLLLR